MLAPLFLTAFSSLSMSAPQAAAQPESGEARIGATDFAQLAQITGLEVAPDGSFAIASVRRVFGDPSDREATLGYRTHLLWLDLESQAESRWLTSGERTASSPVISPDGTRLAFVRTGESNDKDEKGKPQVWILRLDGPGEAEQLTQIEHGAHSPQWAANGMELLVQSSVPDHKVEGARPWDTERVGGEWPEDRDRPEDPEAIGGAELSLDANARRTWLARGDAKHNPFVFDSLDFQGEKGLAESPTYRHLLRVSVETGEATSVLEGFHDPSDVELFTAGGSILFVGRPPGTEAPDRVWRTALYTLEKGRDEPRLLLDLPEWSLGSPRMSADGSTVFFLASDANDPLYANSRLASLDLESNEFRLLTESLDTSVEALRVDDDVLCFRAEQGGVEKLFGFDLASGAYRAIAEPAGSILAYDFSGGEVVYAASTAANPGEVYLLNPAGDDVVLSDLHRSWLSSVELSVPTRTAVTRPDGTMVDSWLMPPVGLAEGASAPLVVEMHGGPHVMWGPGSFSMWHEWQFLCAQGFGVLFANPRGSTGYGEAFQRGNYRNWGTGPAGDVLACVDMVRSQSEWIDGDRLYLTGGSYAGYLTAWIVGHDDRFRAAVAQRGVYDLNTFFGEGNAWRLVEWAFGGFPWQQEVREILQRESPFTTVDQITTPLLILHASSDLRTGVSQSEMMYRALKELRRPVEYVRYPGAGHDLSRTGDPGQRLDRLLRILEFFERHGAHAGN